MEKTLSAYTTEHILRYFDDVKRDGLTEHGFPRLTANIGILIANGRRCDLLPIFLQMMDFCCHSIPTVKAANDFSVREIVCCILEVEKSPLISHEDIARWKSLMATIKPEACYSVYATAPDSPVKNWALFSGVSEYFRSELVGCDSTEFIDVQIASQLQWLDENGMYMDNDGEIHQPMVYDIVPRGLFAILLKRGYRGVYYNAIDEALRKSALCTLYTQSTTGEVPFGGRSNQFLHNEPWLAILFEYEAARYKREGNMALAGKFKAAACKAIDVLIKWFSKEPIYHVKNRFPTDTKFGCEHYAYFDKYMITTASFLYAADTMCDDSIIPAEADESPAVWSTSKHFHKTFARADGYFLEVDTDADPHYDASGLGRIQKAGAPSAICLSMPFAEHPSYSIAPYENKTLFSICPAVTDGLGAWRFGADTETRYTLTRSECGEDNAVISFDCLLDGGDRVEFSCFADENGVLISAIADGAQRVGITLPVFHFDGESYTRITDGDGRILVEYDGWICEYEADNITSLDTEYANRNGVYKGYIACGAGKASVKVKIYPKN